MFARGHVESPESTSQSHWEFVAELKNLSSCGAQECPRPALQINHNMHTSKRVGLVKADKKGGNISIDFWYN